MFQEAPRKAAWVYWVGVVLWTASIYLVIPLARLIQRWVNEHLGRGFFLAVVIAALVAGALAVLVAIARGRVPVSPGRSFWLLATTGAFAWGAYDLRGNPEEAMHYVQYGVLALLLFRALSVRMRDPAVYVFGALVGAMLGSIDEFIQWLVPERFFDFRDMRINIVAGLLMQAAVAFGLRPPYIDQPLSVRSVRLCRIAAVLWVGLLFFMVSNTRDLMQRYERILPPPMRQETMVEYGYQLSVPGAVYLSRLTIDETRAMDQERAAELADLLRDQTSDEAYDRFLRAYPTWKDPFAHELRVRLFRRDRYWQMARAKRGTAEHAELISVAYGENRILDELFPATLAASDRAWPDDMEERARSGILPGDYRSPVSRNLLTVAKPVMQTLLFAVLLAVIAAGRYLSRKAVANP